MINHKVSICCVRKLQFCGRNWIIIRDWVAGLGAGPEYNSIMTISLAEMWTHDTNTNNIIYFLSLINSIIHQTTLQPENLKIIFQPEGRREGGEEGGPGTNPRHKLVVCEAAIPLIRWQWYKLDILIWTHWHTQDVLTEFQWRFLIWHFRPLSNA